jgi:ABC-type phosphate transport system substrate-binding protein
VAQTLTDSNFAPLTNPYRRQLISQLYAITCQGVPVLTTPIVMGIGEQYNLLSQWSQDYQASSFTIKFFNSTSTLAIQQMQMGDSDFAVSQTWQFSSKRSSMNSSLESLVAFPVIAYGLASAYQLAAIANMSNLILDVDTLAGIYTGNITVWNHNQIKALNPTLAPYLPYQPIQLVAGCDDSALIPIMWAALSSATLSTEGVLAREILTKMTTSNSCLSDVVSYIGATDGAFAVWYVTDIITEVRNVQMASLVNPAGNVVQPSSASLAAAVADYAGMIDNTVIAMGPGPDSWPLAGYGMMVLDSEYPVKEQLLAQGLLDWVYWTQTSSTAAAIAGNYLTAVPGQSAAVMQRTIALLDSVTSNSQKVFSLAGCVYNGTICSNQGTCAGGTTCACNSTRTGQWCELEASTSNSVIIAAVLGSVLPIILLLALVVVVAVIIMAVVVSRRSQMDNDWEISFEELEIGEQLGAGGYGEVHKAMWKGTEVAVKVMASDKVTKDMEKNFKDEVRRTKKGKRGPRFPSHHFGWSHCALRSR